MNCHYNTIWRVHNFLGCDPVQVGGGSTNLFEYGRDRTVQANSEITSVSDPDILLVTTNQILNTCVLTYPSTV